MYLNHIIGRHGEDIAVNYLKEKEYLILDRNFSSNQGEIDIIAKKKKEIVFVEVKTRTSNLYGKPIEAIDKRKRKCLLSTIKYYLHINNLENNFVRIDVIEVYFSKKGFNINHTKKVL